MIRRRAPTSESEARPRRSTKRCVSQTDVEPQGTAETPPQNLPPGNSSHFSTQKVETKNKQVNQIPWLTCESLWSRGQDLNLRPSGYEPDELPDCSTPQCGALGCARSNYTHCPYLRQQCEDNSTIDPERSARGAQRHAKSGRRAYLSQQLAQSRSPDRSPWLHQEGQPRAPARQSSPPTTWHDDMRRGAAASQGPRACD